MTTRTASPEAPAAPMPLWDDNGVTLAGLNALREPTPAEEIKQRAAPGGSGKMLDYVDARFVMDRLDVMAGPQNWQDSYEDVPNVSPPAMRCSLSIRVMGAWIVKTDVGDASTIEPTKGASSDAFKRAAVKWGIARDLYDAREDSAGPVQRPSGNGHYGQPPRPAAPPAQRGGTPYQPPAAAQQAAPAGTPPMHVLNPTGWVCPIHGTAVVQPAGVSRQTGNPYPAFVKCGTGSRETGYCNEKPPKAAPVAAPVAPTEQAWPEEAWPEEPQEDLPF